MASTGNSGNGTNNNTFSYKDAAGNTYDREVNAALNNITYDHEGGTLAPGKQQHFPGYPVGAFGGGGVRLPGARQLGVPGL